MKGSAIAAGPLYGLQGQGRLQSGGCANTGVLLLDGWMAPGSCVRSGGGTGRTAWTRGVILVDGAAASQDFGLDLHMSLSESESESESASMSMSGKFEAESLYLR